MAVDIPNLSRYNTASQAGEVGGGIGQGIGRALEAYSAYSEKQEAKAKDEASKQKIDQYIMAYNNKDDQSIFGGLEGSLRTEKLARLLLPLNPDLAKQYSLKANKEKSDEDQLARNKKVADAYRGVSETEEVEDIELSTTIDTEIKLIEERLKQLSSIPAPTEGVDMNVPRNRYSVEGLA